MTEDTAQSNSDSALGKVRPPRSLPGAGGANPQVEPGLRIAQCALSIADARALVDSSLWPRIRAFLWDFASLCDPARLAAAFALPETDSPPPESAADRAVAGSPSPESAADRAVAGSPSHESAADRAVAGHTWPASWPASPRLARAAERALGLSPVFHSFPSTDSSRLLLLSREDYDLLSQSLGVVALAPSLRRVALGAEVRALKAALPGYREALSFAAYFHRFDALFKRFEPADQTANPAAVCSTGHSILAAALSDLPPELLLRQRLRFPAGSPADAALGGASSPSGPTTTVTADHSAFSIQHSALAGEARAAALLALKLFNPQEYKTCFS